MAKKQETKTEVVETPQVAEQPKVETPVVETPKPKRKEPSNKKTNDGWFIPAMNSKRYSCEINRQSYKKMTTPRIQMMQKKDRMQERNIKVNF